MTTTLLSSVTEAIKRDIRLDIVNLQTKRNEIEARIAFLESDLLKDDHSLLPLQNLQSGKPINDLEDRERILQFFLVSCGSSRYKDRIECIAMIMFEKYSNVLFVCREHKLEPPFWFIQKYLQ